jgi:hypothetical protein
MRKKLAYLLLCAAVATTLPSTASASPGEKTPSPQVPSLPSEWLLAASGSSCEGECGTTAEIFVTCGGTSARQCCNSLQLRCLHFSGICTGDAEILCQF